MIDRNLTIAERKEGAGLFVVKGRTKKRNASFGKSTSNSKHWNLIWQLL